MYGHMGYGPFGGFGGFGGWDFLGFGLHGVGMLVFWGLLIWGAIVLFRQATGGGQVQPGALAILAERFARGELTQEQFTDMRKALR